MKYQFQFAGINSDRPLTPQRKRLRLALLSVAFVLAGLVYWNYLYHLTHGYPAATSATPVVTPVAVSTKPPQVIAPTASAPVTPMSPAIKEATETGLAALWTYLVGSAKVAPVANPQTVLANPPTTQSEAAKVSTASAPVAQTTAKPNLHRPPLVRTPEQRLMRAGAIAMGNVLDKASRYPEAYGFLSEDGFKPAKLGNPIPIYTIVEEDRAKYKSGQPVQPMLKPTSQWVFPISQGDSIRCMVRVTYNGHDYVPGEGDKSLAAAWNKIMDKWPTDQGFHPHLVVYPSIPGYYFTVPELPTPNVTDTIHLLEYQIHLSPADVILASWR